MTQERDILDLCDKIRQVAFDLHAISVMVTWKKYMRMGWLTDFDRLVFGLNSNILSRFWM
jgi:hypothetical protein